MATWTSGMDQVLVVGVAEGKSFSTLAKSLGVTRNACVGRWHRLGLQHPRPSGQKFTTRDATAFRKLGWTYRQIAEELGVSVMAVWVRLNKHKEASA